MDCNSKKFIAYLQEKSLEGIQSIPKSDLHNHAGRGGSLCYLSQWAKVDIAPPAAPFPTLADMQDWFEHNVKIHCPGLNGYLKRIEAAFAQANLDHIRVLALSYGPGEIQVLGGMEPFIRTMDALRKAYAPDTVFLPELALDRACDTEQALGEVEEYLAHGWFASIDICCNELAQPIRAFEKIYRMAQRMGVKRKAHTGEFGTAEDVREACESLGLQEVHHGIASAASKKVMQWLAIHNIQLNVCPTSNIMLRRAKGYSEHPIRIIYDNGIPVTINTDDLLIFNQSVSQEYMNLYSSGCMTAQELNCIRLTGLSALS